jgi:Ulp1 family protease
VGYVTRALQKYAKKKIVMFVHNPIGHWILVVIIPKWKKVLYFDSLRSTRDHSVLKEVLSE